MAFNGIPYTDWYEKILTREEMIDKRRTEDLSEIPGQHFLDRDGGCYYVQDGLVWQRIPFSFSRHYGDSRKERSLVLSDWKALWAPHSSLPNADPLRLFLMELASE